MNSNGFASGFIPADGPLVDEPGAACADETVVAVVALALPGLAGLALTCLGAPC